MKLTLKIWLWTAAAILLLGSIWEAVDPRVLTQDVRTELILRDSIGGVINRTEGPYTFHKGTHVLDRAQSSNPDSCLAEIGERDLGVGVKWKEVIVVPCALISRN